MGGRTRSGEFSLLPTTQDTFSKYTKKQAEQREKKSEEAFNSISIASLTVMFLAAAGWVAVYSPPPPSARVLRSKSRGNNNHPHRRYWQWLWTPPFVFSRASRIFCCKRGAMHVASVPQRDWSAGYSHPPSNLSKNGINSELHSSESTQFLESNGGICFTNKWKEASLHPGLGFDNFKPTLELSIFKCFSLLSGLFFGGADKDYFLSKSARQDLFNGNNVAS